MTVRLIIMFFVLCSCVDRKPIIVKSVSFEGNKVQWYFYSDITSTSVSYVSLISKDKEEILLQSNCISDIKINDGIEIQLYCENHKTFQENSFLKIYTNGSSDSSASNRVRGQ